MIEESASDEPLTWGVVANISREVFTRQRTDKKRPGTRHFAPGAKVWVLPIRWGDGGEQRYVVGTRRGTGGHGLVRLVMNTDFLVNLRLKPVYSPAIYARMGQPLGNGWSPLLYDSQEDAEQQVDVWKWLRTRVTHLRLGSRPGTMHNADETCEFCDGRDAALAGRDADDNPHPMPDAPADGSVDWWATDHGMWHCGWLTETNRLFAFRISDLGARQIAIARREARAEAELLASNVTGRTAAELESDGIGRTRLRFVRGGYQPRVLDGIVHAWLDDEDRVVRTQSG
jgi:hypothetical protein